MSKTSLVRPSRDGDQFHYLWAARRCLSLLSADSGLVAVSIEAPSPVEQSSDPPLDAGDESIDIAEYFGSENISQARLVRYMQLKHSTLHANDHWTASGLEKTIRNFSKLYAERLQANVSADLTKQLEFWFVTNRPVSKDVIESVVDAASEAPPRHPAELKKLELFTNLAGRGLADFCKMLHFEGRQDDYWDQRNILFQDVNGYLADADVDAPTQLKELVTRKALSESEDNPTITKIDVLRALKTDQSRLFPANCLLTTGDDVIPREQEPELINQIVAATGPVIVQASGGVGKSVFAMRIRQGLPEGSVSVVYDCFGNGQYRSVVGYRHRHKDALVQIANELSAKSLCHLLIPTQNADASAYVRAFVYRLGQATKLLRLANPGALLCIVVDAADNAQMAAEEIGEARSFARDLIRVGMPEGVRLVFLCRSHRRHYLDPPTETIAIELRPFSRDETAAFLRQNYPDASERDIDEFHRLSSQNPRVEALALSRRLPLQETLRLLGPNPTTVENAIAGLLDNAIGKLKDATGPIEKDHIEKICEGLATLRPLIPISILSAISRVDEEAIKSFAYDIGRPLLVAGGTIQFLDEPAESWFREKFKPSADGMATFIANLRPLATSSAYAASMLPQLMLEAGQFTELVELALSSAALPESSPLEKRDVALQRLQFALKAGLRSGLYVAAAKLALKAGGETAGDDRQRKLLQANTDLAGEFLEIDLIQEIVSRRTFGSGWLGSHHAYEAALLSGRKELVGDARSRLRMAQEWLRNWARLKPEEREEESISDADVVELTMAHLNIHGPEDVVLSLSAWTPEDVSYRVGRTVIRRLIEHGRFEAVGEVAHAAAHNIYLILAMTVELRRVQQTPANEVIERALRHLSTRPTKLTIGGGWDDGEVALGAVTALIEVALKRAICTPEEAVDVLSRYLPIEPPRALSSRFSKIRSSLLRAYCLRAALEGKPIELINLAHAELKAEMDKNDRHSKSRDFQEFEEDIGALLPWHKLWAAILLGQVKTPDVVSEVKGAYDASSTAARSRYRDSVHTTNQIALLWMEIIHESNVNDAEALSEFSLWKGRLQQPLFTPTINSLCRLCAQKDSTKSIALTFAAESYALTKDERSDAESKSEGYLEIARAILSTSKADAKAYFNEAMEVAGKIGDENLARWDALLDLADRAARPNRLTPRVAYQFARCAELTYDYVARDKHFAWTSTVEALCGLCPSSAISILGRWRDRGFGWHERLLPVAVDNLIQRQSIDARDALPFVGFRAQWVYGRLLDSILAKCQDLDERKLAADIVYRYAQFSGVSLSDLKQIREVVPRYGVALAGLDEAISFSDHAEAVGKQTSSRDEYEPPKTEAKPKPIWDDIFSQKDLTTPDGISQAYHAFRSADTPGNHNGFFVEAMRHVSIGSEPGFIEAVGNTPEFDLYHLKDFLEHVPESWTNRRAVSQAISKTLKSFCRRYCLNVTKSRYYEVLPFNLACSLAGISEADVVDVVLAAIGETPDLIDTDRLFSLVGLIAIKLSHDQALETLIYGLDLFNTVLEEKDGDGPWKETLLPPKDIKESIAGYIWSALGAPEAVLRWEAAHAVVELCAFGRQDVLAYLMQLANAKIGGPFVDARLPFYGLHALQWLLIGLARAASQAPKVLASYAKQLVDWALQGQPHVLIRQFAARAALQLISSGELSSDATLSDQLKSINKSPLPVIESRTYERKSERKRTGASEDGEDRFYFGIDMGPYWYAPLGRVFALSQNDIEEDALKVIRSYFAYNSQGRWDEDERGRRDLYEEGHTHHSHGSYPRADALEFYHAYHAMMIVAGSLLATVPTHRHLEYGEEDEFADWLSRHDLSRADERWLWDRRDPQPLERGAWRDRGKDHADRYVVLSEEFKENLTSEGMLNVWGSWIEADAEREQSTHIYSALVSPARSDALLRALASAKNVYDYSIPSVDSEAEINDAGFVLKGWVQEHNRDGRLDKMDRWAGGINFPPPMPAQFIIDAMELETDADRRVWREKDKTYSMASQAWGHYDEAKHHEGGDPQRGSRLQASLQFVTAMLAKVDCDLIIQVQIGRHRRYQPYERGDKDDSERIPTRAKLYLFSKNGNVRSS